MSRPNNSSARVQYMRANYLSTLISGGPTIPRSGLIFYAKAPGMVDTIGLSIETLYPLLDATIQPIVSADGGVTRRADADIVALALASPYLNINGGTLFGDADSIVVLYADGLQPVESAERRLWRKIFDTKFELLSIDGYPLIVDAYPIYMEV